MKSSLYRKVIDDYDYLNMYSPIEIPTHERDLDYEKYVKDYDYASGFVPPALKKPQILDLPESSYSQVIEEYSYADEDEQDPNELLRTAEDYIDYLNIFIKQLNQQVVYLLGENQNYRQLLDTLKGDEDKTKLIEDFEKINRHLRELQKQYEAQTELNEQLILANTELLEETNKRTKTKELLEPKKKY
jgi:hypothetical protein